MVNPNWAFFFTLKNTQHHLKINKENAALLGAP